MKELRDIPAPFPMLSGQQQYLNSETYFAMSVGLPDTQAKLQLGIKNKDAVSKSFSDFFTPKVVNNTVQDFLIEGISPPTSPFSIHVLDKPRTNSIKNSLFNANPYLDGYVGIALCGRYQDEALPLATASISDQKHLFVDRKLRYNLIPNSPMLVQIQAIKSFGNVNNDPAQECRQQRQAIRWEKALVSLVEQWAVSEGLPALYIQASEINYWKKDVDEERLKIRYDTTAQRMGYARDGTKPFFIKILTRQGLSALQV